MLGVLENVFKDKVATPAWQQKIRQIVPSYGTRLNDSAARTYQEWVYTAETLQLTPPPAIDTSARAPQAATKGNAAPARAPKAANDMAL